MLLRGENSEDILSVVFSFGRRSPASLRRPVGVRVLVLVVCLREGLDRPTRTLLLSAVSVLDEECTDDDL